MPSNDTTSNNTLRSDRALTLGSGCVLKFLLHKTNTESELIPVLMLIGLQQGDDEFASLPYSEGGNPRIGIISAKLETMDSIPTITTTLEQPESNLPIYRIQDSSNPWLIVSADDLNNNVYRVVEPRIGIKSLGLKTDSSELNLKYYDKTLKDPQVALRSQTSEIKPYEDYSILSRSNKNEYVLTLNEKLIIKNNYEINNGRVYFEDGPIQLKYSISNADTAIYLDAVQILKENAYPKVSYEATVESVDNNLINTIYNRMGNIVNINDNDLKFKNVRGYISGFTLNLDNPDEDQVEIKNYKTKFEDLFSTITAQTEAMKSNSYMLDVASTAFTPTGQISEEVLQSTIKKVDLDYAFDNGKLTIDELNGIWGTSDTGVVAFRGGGIFTATEKHSNGSWKWNTGITPEGINADLITTGQLDTNLIKIYAGDHLRFQMNGDGIFAYKLNFDSDATGKAAASQTGLLNADKSFDNKQYVVFNDEGLALVAKKGAKVLNATKTDYYEVLNEKDLTSIATLSSRPTEIKRVEISWQGLVLRNWYNQKVFYADPSTGNLTLKGTIEAESGRISGWNFDDTKFYSQAGVDGEDKYRQYVVLNAGTKFDENKNPDVDNDYAIWAGAQHGKDAKFFVKKDGTIKATSGSIGGWNLYGGMLYTENSLALAKDGKQGEIQPPSYDIIDEAGQATSQTPDKISAKYIMWAPGPSENQSTETSIANAKFAVTNDGKILAQQVQATTINSCAQAWFTGSTISRISGNTITYVTPGGVQQTATFNTADGVKTKIDPITINYGSWTFTQGTRNIYNGTIQIKGYSTSSTGSTIQGSEGYRTQTLSIEVVHISVNDNNNIVAARINGNIYANNAMVIHGNNLSSSPVMITSL